MPKGIPATLSDELVVASADPAAGGEFSATVPAGKWWELLSVSVVLVQGITQTPQPILVVDDGTNTLFESFGASGAQGASTTARYTWAPGLPLTALIGTTPNIHATAPLPDGLVLEPGYRVRSATLGIGAGSDYAVAQIWVVEYS